MLSFITVGFMKGFNTAEPTTYVSEDVINHCYDRHTLRGIFIFQLGKLDPATKGDQIALLSLALTYNQMDGEIMKANGQKLAWKHRSNVGHEVFWLPYRG